MSEYIALDVDSIKSNLNTSRIGREIIVYKSTSSTNDIAAEYAKGGEKNNGLAVFAEHQTEGRGRRGNEWLDDKSKSILCSVVIFNPKIGADMITITAAVAVAETIAKTAKIKWPNDILLGAKKVAGILVEAFEKNKKKYFVVGIGINCHQQKQDFESELAGTATSIDIESGTICDRNRIAKRLLVNLEHFLDIAVKDPDEIVERWRAASMLLGKRITIEHNGAQFTGNCIGVEPADGLIIQLERGGVRMFDAVSTTIVKNGTEICDG
jgi:BirA family biotin operon repressor/biotin-[acetyl-CoA-carboxylase] ligase